MAEALKDSKVTWIGKIPEDWRVERISTLYSPRNIKVNDEDYPPLSVTMRGILPQLETVAKTDDHGNRKLVKKGDFVINSRSDRRGSCGISNYDGSVSLINIVLRPNSKMNPAYYNWLFHTPLFADEFYKWGHGIVDDLWTTNWQDMKNIFVTIPPLEEQEQIAIFLDEKCAEIDKLSEDTQKQIDILNEYKRSVITRAVTKGLNPSTDLKDSRVEWIGEIPDSWTITRNKYLLKETYSGGTPTASNASFYCDDGIPFVNISDMSMVDYVRSTAKFLSKAGVIDKHLRILPSGTILYSMYATLGHVSELKIDATISQAMLALLPDYHKINKQFYKYSLFAASEYAIASAAGTTQMNLNAEKVINYYIALPSLAEQGQIAIFLNEKCSNINNSIDAKQEQLDKLSSYKQSIIYEYVTGKKRVA